jgi:hypothetical protein
MIARRPCLVLMLLVLTLVPCAFSQRTGQDSSALARFQNALKHNGFDVTAGVALAWNPAAAYCAGTADSAMYTNNEPYLQLLVPKSVQEPNQLNNSFQLNAAEAVVLIGVTPPPARYFSYTPTVTAKVYLDGKQALAASLGDSVNNATVKTTASTPFNAPVVLIFTPDRTTDARIRAALESAGYPAGIVNTVVLPASILTFGYGDTADDVGIALRNAMFTDPIAGKSYIENAAQTLHVFRVTPHTAVIPDPLPLPRLRVRGTGQSELGLMKKLMELRAGIIAAHPGLQPTEITVKPGAYEGYDYIQRGVTPMGDTRDSFYFEAGWTPEYGSNDRITLGDDEFLVFYGVNHIATGKATYMNVNITAGETEKLSVGTLDDRVFPGAAPTYLPAGDAAASQMYAYKVSRKCAADELNCLPLSVPEGCTRLTLNSQTILGFPYRVYLEPATRVGAALPEILYDRILKFSPR